jgi:hypothetical protein
MCYLSCSEYSVPNGTQDRFPSLRFLLTLSLSVPDFWGKASLPIFAEGLDK